MWNAIRTWIYPDKCMICRKLLTDVNGTVQCICCACEQELFNQHICSKCGKPYAVEDTCLYCGEMPRGITRIMSLFPYRDDYKASVKRWKYKGIRRYGAGFAKLMASELIGREGVSIDVLIPIPISDKRYAERGFNQALDLAREVSKLTNIPVYDVLSRNKNTKPQSACTKQERRENIRGSIKVNGAISDLAHKNIAFIDDIYTTGSTVQECIKVIKENVEDINEEVYVLTVCLAI